jgi:hypothetical protein
MPQNNATIPTTDVALDLTRATLVDMFKDQFAHLDGGELRTLLESTYGNQVWNNEELLQRFEVSHFEPPYVHVISKTDGIRGTVAFNDEPRFYFSFRPAPPK